MQRLREGIPLDTIMAEALRSDEFLASHPTPVQSADDVDALYRAACHAPPPDVDRTLPPGAYAAQVLTAAEIGRPSRISDILFAEGLDPADGSDYRVWLADFHEPDPATREAAARSGSGPLAVSLVLLGGWTGGAALVATLDSVRGQLCRRFELVVAGSRRFCASASRLASSATVVSRRETDAAALLNAALPHCQGRFILPLRPGTRLSPDAGGTSRKRRRTPAPQHCYSTMIASTPRACVRIRRCMLAGIPRWRSAGSTGQRGWHWIPLWPAAPARRS